ncbi:concanavalin A-like lectin/glucanase [Pseudovirgaria hyperparasitica]|uniref:Concanavalin A-like lectin/glucanase n=1 Tax=Pseudovirgaria hyperparasitica TaxID=470096 RepID=A0A6A6VT52_9PEZI|nr:concanavalin A-like lectin/glucanase [Pseudovirgaria hyperparasitica]KAF2752770.1 concanavalin A-like lectin/glucanase [Pseudovirgaria hyperparasitica]
MPFSSRIQSFIDKAEQKVTHEVQQRFPNAPPVPTLSKPRPQPGAAYWQPQFSPNEPVSTHFQHMTGQHGWGNNEAQNYIASPETSFCGTDTLTLRAIIQHNQPENAHKFTSARLTSHQTFGRPRGSLSAHIIAPVAQGIWPAFWLLPAEPYTWPTDGEIDIFEAWNGEATNHSCLHWGHFNGPDHDKHRVVESPIPGISAQGARFDFAWEEDEATGQGRFVWYIDSKPVMKASKPAGTRRMRDFRIMINIAVGGNVCKGKMPGDGTYEMVVRNLAMWEEPPGGWGRFNGDFCSAREGHMM